MSWPLLTKISWGHVPGWPKAGAGTDVFRGSPSADHLGIPQHHVPGVPGVAPEVQKVCYSHEGTLNKFLIDDKGMRWAQRSEVEAIHHAPQCVLIYSTSRSTSLFSSLPGISRNCVVDHFRGMACVFFEMDSSTTVTSIPRSARRWYPSFLLVSKPSWSMDVSWGL